MINELWKYSSTAQELIAEGRKEGREEGRKEGRKEGELRMIRAVLERRSGSLDAKLIQALGQVEIATLEELVADTTLTREQLEARLGLHS